MVYRIDMSQNGTKSVTVLCTYYAVQNYSTLAPYYTLATMKKAHHGLEHRFGSVLKRDSISGGTLVVGVSGGLDSMALAHLLNLWSNAFKYRLRLAHVHHGYEAENQSQNVYRDRAQEFVKNWAYERDLDFITNPPEPTLHSSEADLRAFRYSHFHKWLSERNESKLALAHHADDLLETRLIRMIRGTGAQGLESMVSSTHELLRPLLTFSRQEIEVYAREIGLIWVEDPSNQYLETMRNWVRKSWLFDLESTWPGAKASLARSMGYLVQRTQRPESLSEAFALRRGALSEMGFDEKAQVVARFLRGVGARGYTHTHVEEILKRLESKSPSDEFEIVGFRIHLTPDLVWASRV